MRTSFGVTYLRCNVHADQQQTKVNWCREKGDEAGLMTRMLMLTALGRGGPHQPPENRVLCSSAAEQGRREKLLVGAAGTTASFANVAETFPKNLGISFEGESDSNAPNPQVSIGVRTPSVMHKEEGNLREWVGTLAHESIPMDSA
ncbi:unnamed protein product [Linum trigynum]|uniref:Uncharacterized protein n=1 Tax=Linum trigynum TaxID=586398 RepID=A0AAV2FTP7_9ROSI